MTQKTKTTKQVTSVTEAEAQEVTVPSSQMSQDLRTAVLIVSVVLNLFVFTAWIALQVTSQYDAQLASFIFNR